MLAVKLRRSYIKPTGLNGDAVTIHPFVQVKASIKASSLAAQQQQDLRQQCHRLSPLNYDGEKNGLLFHHRDYPPTSNQSTPAQSNLEREPS